MYSSICVICKYRSVEDRHISQCHLECFIHRSTNTYVIRETRYNKQLPLRAWIPTQRTVSDITMVSSKETYPASRGQSPQCAELSLYLPVSCVRSRQVRGHRRRLRPDRCHHRRRGRYTSPRRQWTPLPITLSVALCAAGRISSRVAAPITSRVTELAGHKQVTERDKRTLI